MTDENQKTPADRRRVRICGDGKPGSTHIADAQTGERIGPVVRYTITQERHQFAHGVVEVLAPQIDLEVDVEVVQVARKQCAPGEAPRVTPERIESLLARVMYRYDNPEDTTSTFAHAYLDGEFYLASGFSACVSKENFDADKGRQYALKDAEPKVRAELWKLEGYALRLRLEGDVVQ